MKNWLLAIRIKTLTAAISPVIIGSVLAYHDGLFKGAIFVIILITAILIQIGANIANDVYDFEKGSDRPDRLGPKRVTQAGLISPRKMKQGMGIVFSLAICCGTFLVNEGGWPIVCIGLASIAAGIAYTGGPYPLGYHGWGDVFVFIFFGLIAVPGTYYLHLGYITKLSIYAGVAMGMLSSALLLVNNIRDIDEDKLSGKKTLAVRIGENASRFQYMVLMLLPLFFPIYFWWIYNKMSLLISLFLFPYSFHLIKKIYLLKGVKLNKLLENTSHFIIMYTLLFSIGLIV